MNVWAPPDNWQGERQEMTELNVGRIEDLDKNRQAVVVRPQGPTSISVNDLKLQRDRITQLMQTMVKGTHFIDPASEEGSKMKLKKPMLTKPGAEMLAFVFHIALETTPTFTTDANGEITVLTKVVATNRDTGQVLGVGTGLASTGESKFNYVGRKTPADVLNNVLQMSAKRATVPIVRIALAVSDIFDDAEQPEVGQGVVGGTRKAKRASEMGSQGPGSETAKGAAIIDASKAATPAPQTTSVTPTETNADSSAGETPQETPVGVSSGGPPRVRIVKAETAKTGTNKNGKPYTLYAITDSNGTKHKTFSKSVFELASKLIDSEQEAYLSAEMDSYSQSMILELTPAVV